MHFEKFSKQSVEEISPPCLRNKEYIRKGSSEMKCIKITYQVVLLSYPLDKTNCQRMYEGKCDKPKTYSNPSLDAMNRWPSAIHGEESTIPIVGNFHSCFPKLMFTP